MSHNARQSLSALMDNEGDDLELRRVLASLEDAPEAAESWRRYHLVRSVMHRESDVDAITDLSAGIMAKLEAEPAPLGAAQETSRTSSVSASPVAKGVARRSMPLARSAGIAAAVSLMVITGVQFYNGASPLGAGDEASSVASSDMRNTQNPLQGSASQASTAQASSSKVPSLVDLPMFQSTSNARPGVMTVGASSSSPVMLSPSQQQSRESRVIDQQQALLLQSYLNRHAEGAAASAGDAWLPLLRASGNEPLSNR